MSDIEFTIDLSALLATEPVPGFEAEAENFDFDFPVDSERYASSTVSYCVIA